MTLASGTLAAQLLVLASAPALARLYTPAEFGVWGIYLAVVITLTVVINGGYEIAIMLPKRDKDAHQLVKLCILIATGAAVLVALFIGIWGPWVFQKNEVPELIDWRLLLPLSLWLEGIYQPLYQQLNRLKRYRTLSLSKWIKAIFQVGISLWLGFAGYDWEGLLGGYVAGQISGTGWLIWKYAMIARKEKWSWKMQLTSLHRRSQQYRDFPTYGVLSAWLNTASKQLPFFLLPGLVAQGKIALGHFQQTQKLLSLPVSMVGMAMGSVFYEQAAKALAEGEAQLAQLTRKTARASFLLGIGPTLLVMAFGQELFAFVLGEEWRTAGYYAQWLMPWMFMSFITLPLSYLVDIRRKLGVYLLFNLQFFICQLLILWLGGKFFYLEADQLIIIYGLGGFLWVTAQFLYFLFLGLFFGGTKK